MSQSTTFMLSKSQSNQWRRGQNTTRYGQGAAQLGPVAHTVIVAVLLCVMGLMYLAQINKTNAYTYPINELETKKSALLDEQQQLKVESARLASLESIKNNNVASSMTSPRSVDSVTR